MKDDPEFNMNFVSIVENFPCLYDHTSTDYSKRNVVEHAWEEVAKEISECVQDCKERWKNLRACYTRHLKALSDSEAKAKRPYYLAEHLNFLQPYTKQRKPKDIYKVPQIPYTYPEETLVAEYEMRNDFKEENQDSLPENEESNTVGLKITQVEHLGTTNSKNIAKFKYNSNKNDVSFGDVNKSAHDYSRTKTSSTEEEKFENPDLNFFKSVLPDMNEMTSDQKRRFKIGILTLAGQILNEDKPVLSRPSSSSSPKSLHGF